ncbi:MAG TPA: aminomethyltransferase beta-barrel domain-containing protein, partial [Candidatus Binatia bacterium]|nr:aminomethyltransferase beta-barrel domain-containing protein [Candidatus Binatia bacterium]
TGTAFIDDTLTNGTTYYYVVSSVGAQGEGPDSAEVATTPTSGAPPPVGTTLAVRIRHRHPPIPCRLVAAGDGVVQVAFAEAGPAVTPGQAAVFYRGDLVLGGGWIARELA